MVKNAFIFIAILVVGFVAWFMFFKSDKKEKETETTTTEKDEFNVTDLTSGVGSAIVDMSQNIQLY